MVQLGFELGYHNIAVQSINHYKPGTMWATLHTFQYLVVIKENLEMKLGKKQQKKQRNNFVLKKKSMLTVIVKEFILYTNLNRTI